MMKKNKCVVCGFDKKVEEHHIIKRKDFGSDDEKNLIYLCLNHRWIADFGEPKDRKIILEKTIEITGKNGCKISEDEKEYMNKKAMFLLSQVFPYLIDDEKEWERMLATSNYESVKNWLLGVGVPKEYSRKLNKKAEILILIDKLTEEIPKL